MRIAMAGCRGVPALYSGFETAATEIGVRLVERGHDVAVYCRKGYGDESEPEYKGIKKIYLPRLNVKVADTLSHTFLAFLHSAVKPPDVLIVFNGSTGPLCVIPRLRGIPFAVNVDGLEWKRGKWPWIGRKYFYFASWFCTKIAPAIIADSQGIQEFYRNQWGCETYYAAYGGHIEQSRRPELLAEFGVRPREYFLVVARLEPENNTDLIVRAFEGVKTDKKLVIVGGTNYPSAYVRDLKDSVRDSRICFTGGVYDQEKLTELMCNCYGYIHGHMVGGTNPVLLKALGCSACVLFAEVNFNAEVVNGAGLSFPIDVDGARATIQRVADDPSVAEQLRRQGPDRIRAAYTWEYITDQYEELCRRLNERRPAYAEA
jgi:glycosyltransferase involved in cell wall biosynthesis